ncbi:MAG: hypothetical protein J0I31_03170 [Rhizobiales bacterium]|nr:hypothetical protein [Hyphomicrobiales bacterium]
MTALRMLGEADTAIILERIQRSRSPAEAERLRTGVNGLMASGRLSEAAWETLHNALDGRFPPRPALGMARAGSGARPSIFPPRRRQCPPDPDKAKRERRRLSLRRDFAPLDIVAPFTECQRAVLFVIAEAVKAVGACDFPIAKLAAKARCSRSSVHAALRLFVERGLIAVQRRPRPGGTHLTNLVRIVSPVWLSWIRRSLAGEGANRKSHPKKDLKETKGPPRGMVTGGPPAHVRTGGPPGQADSRGARR